jgi:hypothetical protein
MMAFKDRLRQIIELLLAGLALLALSLLLVGVEPALDDLRQAARRTPHALWPAQLAHHFIALGIVHQVLDLDQHAAPPDRDFRLSYINLLETS